MGEEGEKIYRGEHGGVKVGDCMGGCEAHVVSGSEIILTIGHYIRLTMVLQALQMLRCGCAVSTRLVLVSPGWSPNELTKARGAT